MVQANVTTKLRRPRQADALTILGMAGMLLLGGCHNVGRVFDPLNVLGLDKPPVRVGVTSLDPSALILPKWEGLRRDMSFYLNDPVQFEVLTHHQLRVHLGTGRLQFALLKPGDYAEIMPSNHCEVLAMPTAANGQTFRQGLIIASPKSETNSLKDVRAQRFHFLPHGDLLNDAALGSLMDSGLSKEDIDRGILGLGLDTHHLNSLEVAKSVVLEQSVGVIDEADYNKWPKSGGSLLLLTPSQSQVRVIGKTVRVPMGFFVVSTETSKEMRQTIEKFLFEVAPKYYKLSLASLGFTGFAKPGDAREYEPFCDVYRRLNPPSTQPAESQAE